MCAASVREWLDVGDAGNSGDLHRPDNPRTQDSSPVRLEMRFEMKARPISGYELAWQHPVIIALRVGQTRTVRSTRCAADCRVDAWPESDPNPEHDEALRICLAVIEDDVNPEAARTAFIAAARARGLKVTL